MERSSIRKRWQVTIPRKIRRELNFFEGQVLNWQIVPEDWGGEKTIRVFPGSYADPEEAAAFKDRRTRKERHQSRQKQRRSPGEIFGKLDSVLTHRGRSKLKGILMEVMTDIMEAGQAGKGISGNPPRTGPKLN